MGEIGVDVRDPDKVVRSVRILAEHDDVIVVEVLLTQTRSVFSSHIGLTAYFADSSTISFFNLPPGTWRLLSQSFSNSAVYTLVRGHKSREVYRA